jgi:hypothetical protein
MNEILKKIVAAGLLLFFIGGALSIPATSLAAESRTESIEEVYLYPVFLGRDTNFSFNYKVDQPRDVLVNLYDSTGSYIVVRKTLDPRYSSDSVQLRVPHHISAPETAALSFWIVPVGDNGSQKLFELNRRINVIVANPIRERLFYNYPLSFFEAGFGRSISNHDGVKVFVKRNEQRIEMGFLHSGYGTDTSIVLNLVTGEIVQTKLQYSGESTNAAYSPHDTARRDEYIGLIREIKKNFEYVESGRGAGFEPDYPQLREVNRYLCQVLLQIDPVKEERLQYKTYEVLDTPPHITDLRQGKEVVLKFRYAAKERRYLVVDFYAAGNKVMSSNVVVERGEDIAKVKVAIPRLQSKKMEAKFVYRLAAQPNGAGGADSLENSADFDLMPPSSIDGVNASDRVSKISDMYLCVIYTVEKPMDLRVDIFDSQNRWVYGRQYTLPQQVHGYFSDFTLDDTIALQNGQNYKIYFKLLPVGGHWSQYVDQAETTFLKEE